MRFQIPDTALPAFTELSKLTTEDADKIISFLQNIPIGINFEDFTEGFKRLNLNSKEIRLGETVFSFGSLLADEKDSNIEMLARLLTEAYQDRKEDIDENEPERLYHNLLLIFTNADSLKKTFKAVRLLTQNANSYRDSNVITDMRPLFNDDLQSTPTCGMILHQLKIEYKENDKRKSFYVSLNKEDISELIDNLQRALNKEEIIKSNQTGINFIELK